MTSKNTLWLSALCAVLFGACNTKPEITPELAQQLLLQRNLGLAYLEEGKLREAAQEFQKMTEAAPQEPLGFANLGLANLRLRRLAEAEAQLQKALTLAPQHAEISLLLAQFYVSEDKPEQAQQILENSLRKNSKHTRTLYQLARLAHDTNAATAESCLNQVVNSLPANVAANLELVELLLRNGKPVEALQHLENARQILPALPDATQTLFQQAVALAQNSATEEALAATRKFHNVLKASSFYQAARKELQGAGGELDGEPLRRFAFEIAPFTRKRNSLPAALRFAEVLNSGFALEGVVASSKSDETPNIIFAHGDFDANGEEDIFVAQWNDAAKRSRQYLFANHNGTFSEVAAKAGLTHPGRDLAASFADYDNDGYLDLFVVNTQAARLYHNNGNGTFSEIKTSMQNETRARAALFVDLDLEGDLDLFLTTNTTNKFYRNNADGTFAALMGETGVDIHANGRQAAAADFDDDGDVDLFVANAEGSNQYFDNLRQGYFRETAAQVGLASSGEGGAVTVGDYNNDGYFDLFVPSLRGQHALYRNRGDGTFVRDTSADSVITRMVAISGHSAEFFDVDNDGWLDCIVVGIAAEGNGARLFYNDGTGKFWDASPLLPELTNACSQVDALDYDNDGDLDLLLASAHGVHLWRNEGGNINNYITVRLTGLRTGSGKNNFFGIGSKVEVKAGDLTQVRVMSEPIAHFGLGEREAADVARVVWSNGVAQNWLNPERNQTITEDQILKGSCPWLYAWNGARYEFVTDVLWTSALGMPLGIMGKEMGYAFAQSGQDYLKISGESLSSKEGKYLLQFTSELWEASFVDRIKLIAVDHPDSAEIFVDEKFTPPPYPALRVYAVANKRRPRSARDEKGNDLLAKIARADGEYISNFIPGTYQGIAEPHELVLDLGDLSHADSVFLFLQGWIFPTDASINVLTAQGNGVKAAPPSLEVRDEQGKWTTIIASMGFPKGKNKMMVFDLSGKFLSRDYRVRIRTNMQIYWDHIFFATQVMSTTLQLRPLEVERADLHYRGFSEVTRATPYSPHVPNYQHVTAEQKWRDLTGAYTRYGEVRELLLESDSKYVIMNAGDEMTLTFDATPLVPLPAGWKRDFVFFNDGWVKDGDLNTAHGQTVEPLPFQEMKAYPYGAAEAYPSDEEHTRFREEYNTRAVNTKEFKRTLFIQKSLLEGSK